MSCIFDECAKNIHIFGGGSLYHCSPNKAYSNHWYINIETLLDLPTITTINLVVSFMYRTSLKSNKYWPQSLSSIIYIYCTYNLNFNLYNYKSSHIRMIKM